MLSGCLARVVSSDARHNFLLHYLTAAAVLLATPVLFGLAELDRVMAAQPLEIMPPLMGLILLTPLLSPEQNEGISGTVRSKQMSRQLVTGARVVCSLVVLALLTGALTWYMYVNDCDVTVKMFAGAFAGAAALGALGFFVSAVTDNAIAGYMVSVMYYVIDLFMREKLGRFCLMSMTCNIEGSKPVLAASALVLTAAAMLFRKVFRNEP